MESKVAGFLVFGGFFFFCHTYLLIFGPLSFHMKRTSDTDKSVSIVGSVHVFFYWFWANWLLWAVLQFSSFLVFGNLLSCLALWFSYLEDFQPLWGSTPSALMEILVLYRLLELINSPLCFILIKVAPLIKFSTISWY